MQRRTFLKSLLATGLAGAGAIDAAASAFNRNPKKLFKSAFMRNHVTAGETPFSLTGLLSRIGNEDGCLSLFSEKKLTRLELFLNGKGARVAPSGGDAALVLRDVPKGPLQLTFKISEPGLNTYDLICREGSSKDSDTRISGSFRTPASRKEHFSMLLVADCHAYQPSNHFGVQEGVAGLGRIFEEYKDDIHLIHFLGDHIWEPGRTPGSLNNIFSKQELAREHWHYFRKLYQPYTGLANCSFTLGNHDAEFAWAPYHRYAAEARLSYFPCPDNASKLQNYYSFEWGNALFLNIDPYYPTQRDPHTNSDWTIGEEQEQWFRETLEKSRARFKFVLQHHLVGGAPLSASGKEEGGYGRGGAMTIVLEKTEQNRLHEIMAANGVTACIRGHDHRYVVEKLDGVNYICVPKLSRLTTVNNIRYFSRYYLDRTDEFTLRPAKYVSAAGMLKFEGDRVVFRLIRTRHDHNEGITHGQVGDVLDEITLS